MFIAGSCLLSIVVKFYSSSKTDITIVVNEIDVLVHQKASSNWLTGSKFTAHAASSKKFKSLDVNIEINTVPCSNATESSLLNTNVMISTVVMPRVTDSGKSVL